MRVPPVSHFHLVIETPGANLVVGMKWLSGVYTKRFNIRHKLCGHLLAGRYKVLILDGSGDGYLRTVCDPGRQQFESGHSMVEPRRVHREFQRRFFFHRYQAPLFPLRFYLALLPKQSCGLLSNSTTGCKNFS